MPSSRSASPTFPGSDGGRLAHPAAALAFKLAIAPLLIAQALRTRRHAAVLPEAGGPRDGLHPGPVASSDAATPLRILVAGDSSAAGVGVDVQDRAVVGHLVRTLARLHDGPVRWCLRARSGLSTRGVHTMLEDDPPEPVDVAVVITGVNDVLGMVTARRAVQARAALADFLLDRGLAGHVVFAPLPPIHQFPLLPDPLRRVLGGDARRHDRALGHWAATHRDVSHVTIDLTLGPATMASDGFHPGEPVYRVCGEALGAHVAKTFSQMGK